MLLVFAGPSIAFAVSEASRCSVIPEDTCSGVCPGDCDDDGRVTVAELLVGVSALLVQQPSARCASLDADRNDRVSVAELVRAVTRSLDGCPVYSAVPQVGMVSFVLSWIVYRDAPDLVDPYSWPEPPANEFSIYSQRIYRDEWRAQRLDASPRSIVVIGVDAGGNEVARWVDNDSRWVVFDCRDPTASSLCGREFYYSRTAVSAYLPYQPEIVELELYETSGTWGSIELHWLGSVPVEIL